MREQVPAKDDSRHPVPNGRSGVPGRAEPGRGGPAHAAVLRLQRRAGNRATTAALVARPTPGTVGLSGPPVIQRKPGYLVCPADKDTTALPDDPHQRHYKWVTELPPGAVQARDHPSWMWYTLHEVPTIPAREPAPVETGTGTGTGDSGETPDVEDRDEVAADRTGDQELTGTQAQKKPRKKKRRKKKPATDKDPVPTEPAWATVYEKTAASKLKMQPGLIKQNIPYLEKELAAKTKALDTQITELQKVWMAELGSFEDKADSLRSDMPEWDGDAGTIIKAFPNMDNHVLRAKTYVAGVKKLAELDQVIGSANTIDLLSQFSLDGLLKYASAVGHARLLELMSTRHVPAAALKHYGAELMRSFVGAGDQLWTHLTTVSLNDKGIISGGHDEGVFNAFLPGKGYTVVNPPLAPGDVYKVTYQDNNGIAKGSKTLIKGLKANKGLWMPRFEEAVWRAVANRALSNGAFSTDDATGQDYDGFYDKGSTQVTTMWPR